MIIPGAALAIHLLVADEEVRLPRGLLEVREDLVAAVDREHRDQLRLLDGTAVLAVADIHDHGARAALRRVRNAVRYPQVVKASVGMTILADVFRLVDVLHVDDHVLRTARYREQVVVRGEHVMHATGELLIEGGRDFRMRRNREIQNHDAVDPVRRAFA